MAKFKHFCWLNTQFMITRYLMSNADGRLNAAEKAAKHMELCIFYVAAIRGIDTDAVRRCYPRDYQAVHEKTQELTSCLDTAIGFPITGRPDYERLEPEFFDRFHDLALKSLND